MVRRLVGLVMVAVMIATVLPGVAVAADNISGSAGAWTGTLRSLDLGGNIHYQGVVINDGSVASRWLKVNANGSIDATIVGGGGGGTFSTFGAAVPTTGTAAGFSDGTNMQTGRVFDADTGGGVQFVLGAMLRKPASGGSVEFGTATDPLIASLTKPTMSITDPYTARPGGRITTATTTTVLSGTASQKIYVYELYVCLDSDGTAGNITVQDSAGTNLVGPSGTFKPAAGQCLIVKPGQTTYALDPTGTANGLQIVTASAGPYTYKSYLRKE